MITSLDQPVSPRIWTQSIILHLNQAPQHRGLLSESSCRFLLLTLVQGRSAQKHSWSRHEEWLKYDSQQGVWQVIRLLSCTQLIIIIIYSTFRVPLNLQWISPICMNPLHATNSLNVRSHCLRCSSLSAVQRHHPLVHYCIFETWDHMWPGGAKGTCFSFIDLLMNQCIDHAAGSLLLNALKTFLQLVGPSLYRKIANSWTLKFLEVRTLPPLVLLLHQLDLDC